MDIAQIFGDYIQLLGMIVLLAKLWLTKNCAGISGKTQLLHAMVFTLRFMELTIRYISLYNTILKTIYTSISYCTVLSIFLFFRKTYDRKRDAFRIELLILPCAIFALFMNYEFKTIEVLWTFSVYLEAVAIIPQVYLSSKSKQLESIVISYVACLGLYRGCYLMHWTYAYLKHAHLEKISIASGLVQLIFYCDFFARNLPILKPKNCASSFLPEPIETTKVLEPTKDAENSREPDPQIGKSTVVLTPASLATEEKVTLLTPKEQGTVN